MDRKEFSNMLVEARKEAGKSQFDMALLLVKPVSNFHKMECGANNFKVKMAQEYLLAINYILILYSNSNSETVLATHEDIVKWVEQCAKKIGGQSQLAKKSDLHYQTISQIITRKSDISIDSFLSIANACRYEVKIQKNSHTPLIKTNCDSDLIPIISGLSILGYTVSIYKSGSRYLKISDKGDVSLFLNKCIKSHGGKEKIASELNLTEDSISNIVSCQNTTVADFKSIVIKCGYEIKIEKL